jgi:hypothetical protein
MSEVMWINIPLMMLVFALMAGIPLWLVLRRSDWHGKPESRTVPTYVARRATPVRIANVRIRRPVVYSGRSLMRPLTGGANG